MDSINKYKEKILIIILLCVAIFCSFLIPHDQSPDEPAHIFRAYSILNGDILLTKHERSVGTEIDKGLIKYLQARGNYIRKHDKKLNTAEEEKINSIRFAKDKEFRGFNTHALYFPASYIPHAIGIGLGKLFNASIFNTICLVRILCLGTIGTLLFFAQKLTAVPLPAFILLFMPMSIFQLGSTTTDGIHFALIAFIMSALYKLYKDGYSYKLLTVLNIAIFVLITHRINFFPIALLPALLYFKEKNKQYLFGSGIVMLCTLFWIFYAMKTVPKRESDVGLLRVMLYYISNPIATLKILANTFQNANLVNFYHNSFVGQLGYLDYKVKQQFIEITYIFLTFTLLLYLKIKYRIYDVLVMLCAIGIFVLTYFILLVQWTKFPCTTIISGVQGRYLIPIAIMLSYPLFEGKKSSFFNTAVAIGIGIYGFFSLYYTVIATLSRYYIK